MLSEVTNIVQLDGPNDSSEEEEEDEDDFRENDEDNDDDQNDDEHDYTGEDEVFIPIEKPP